MLMLLNTHLFFLNGKRSILNSLLERVSKGWPSACYLNLFRKGVGTLWLISTKKIFPKVVIQFADHKVEKKKDLERERELKNELTSW